MFLNQLLIKAFTHINGFCLKKIAILTINGVKCHYRPNDFSKRNSGRVAVPKGKGGE